MITGWEVYWITRLDSINFLLNLCFWTLFVILLLIICFYPIVRDLAFNDSNEKTIKCLKGFAIGAIIFAVSATITPNTKEAVAIYLLPKIANNEQVQKVPENFMKLLNAKMEEWISVKKEEKK